MPTPHPLYAHLRELREARGWSQEKAAAFLGIAQSVLGSYERQNRNPTAVQLDAVYRGYGERLAIVPEHVTDERLAEALAWIAARQDGGVVELGATA